MLIRCFVKRCLRAGIVALGFSAAPAFAQQDYPNRPIRLITPAAQGGTTDILARVFGARLADVFKQQVLVDNCASASGVTVAHHAQAHDEALKAVTEFVVATLKPK